MVNASPFGIRLFLDLRMPMGLKTLALIEDLSV